MEKYRILETVGKGSFGEVFKAQNIETGEIVAIKTMKQKYQTWEECMNLRELKSLRKLIHKNIVKLKEVIRQNNQLSFVFEHVDLDIYKLYDQQKKTGQKLPESQIKSIFYQLAQSLAFIHKHGFFHRDLKPENILFNQKTKYIKLIDFGLAREIRSRPPYTDYVSTRWYRAPELLLRSTNYNSPVDIFALGCIMAELYMLKPLFNGASEQDQLVKICSILGTPSKSEWPEGYRLASLKAVNFPQYPSIPLQNVITDCPYQAIQLISECLKWDAQKRPTAQKILQHPYFLDIESVLPDGYFNDEQQNQNPDNNEQIQKIGKSEEIGGKQRLSNQFSVSDGQINNKLRGIMDPGSPLDNDNNRDSSNNLNDYLRNNNNINNKNSRNANRNQLNQYRASRKDEERKPKEKRINYNELGNMYGEDNNFSFNNKNENLNNKNENLNNKNENFNNKYENLNNNNNNSINNKHVIDDNPLNNNNNNYSFNYNRGSGQKNRATSLQQKNEFNFNAKQKIKIDDDDQFNNNDILGSYIPSLSTNNNQNKIINQQYNNSVSDNKKNQHNYNFSNDFLNQNLPHQNISLQQEFTPGGGYQSSIETGNRPNRNLYQFNKFDNVKTNQYSGSVFSTNNKDFDNIYNFSNKGNQVNSFGQQQFNKNKYNFDNLNNNSSGQINNIYDFNNVRQPVRNLGIQKNNKFDNKNF